MSRVRKDWSEADVQALRELIWKASTSPLDEFRFRRLFGRYRRAFRAMFLVPRYRNRGRARVVYPDHGPFWPGSSARKE